jgi:hypothetical protein
MDIFLPIAWYGLLNGEGKKRARAIDCPSLLKLSGIIWNYYGLKTRSDF